MKLSDSVSVTDRRVHCSSHINLITRGWIDLRDRQRLIRGMAYGAGSDAGWRWDPYSSVKERCDRSRQEFIDHN